MAVSIYVLLSRLRTFDHLLLLRPPTREFLDGGPPAALAAEYARLAAVETRTIRSLEATLRNYRATTCRTWSASLCSQLWRERLRRRRWNPQHLCGRGNAKLRTRPDGLPLLKKLLPILRLCVVSIRRC